MNKLALTVLCAWALSACLPEGFPPPPVDGSGNPDTSTAEVPGDNVPPLPPGDDGAALAAFVANVQPILGQCTGCHEAGGVGPTLFGATGTVDDYDSIVSDSTLNGGFQPGVASLLTKGPHSGALWWSAEQSVLIAAWLNLEYASRIGGADNGEPALTADEIMAAWVGCMLKGNWDDANMGDWADKEAEDNTCAACHSDGEFGFSTNPSNRAMYEQQLTYLGSRSFFKIEVNAAGVAAVAPAVEKIVAKCQAQNLHPECDTDDEYFGYLDDFYRLTQQTQEAGNCNPPGFSDIVLTAP